MMNKRRHIMFPLVLVLVTVLLAIAIGLFVSPRAVSAPLEERSVTAPVTEAGYREAAKTALAPVLTSLDASGVPTDAAAVSQAYETLLALSVPTSYKDVHMALVTSLYLLRDGLAGDAAAQTNGAARFSATLQANAWLN